jgi:hypothetical protein
VPGGKTILSVHIPDICETWEKRVRIPMRYGRGPLSTHVIPKHIFAALRFWKLQTLKEFVCHPDSDA